MTAAAACDKLAGVKCKNENENYRMQVALLKKKEKVLKDAMHSMLRVNAFMMSHEESVNVNAYSALGQQVRVRDEMTLYKQVSESLNGTQGSNNLKPEYVMVFKPKSEFKRKRKYAEMSGNSRPADCPRRSCWNFWRTGSCKYGAKCIYAHTPKSLASGPRGGLPKLY